MRLVIDLQGCQSGTPEAIANALAAAKTIVRDAYSHEVWLAMSGQFPETIERLKEAFSQLLPLERVVVYQLPDARKYTESTWGRSASELVRDSFLTGLGADVLIQAQDCNADFANAKLWSQLEMAPSDASAQSTAKRPRLAYVSPVPPEKSGIADYSVELIPELSLFYDIDLVVDQAVVDAPWINANVPLRSVAWFEEHASDYDRVLYHVGNSPAHKHMFGLMERHPGVVVLHDFYLANVIDYLDHSGYRAGQFLPALYASHGWPALMDRQVIGADDAVWKYPCNKAVLDQAEGVIVHSAFARQLADQWYGTGYAKHWSTLPLLRGQVASSERADARASLGLAEDEFVVCSFGMLGKTKLNDKLLAAWLASPLALDPLCKLVFVGENDGGRYGDALLKSIAKSAAKGRITITGFVSHALYHTYLAACDAAVQLRSQTRGETSAAVLDCLLHGAPTIVNAHGAIAELPNHVLLKLEDQFSDASLIEALVRLWQEPGLRVTLGNAAKDFVAAEHSPGKIGALYRDAIEHFAKVSPQRNCARLVEAIGSMSQKVPANKADLLLTATSIALNLPHPAPRQLFVDVSAMVKTDLKTGIQRVVRSILMALFNAPPSGYRVEPVYSAGGGAPYRYARRYMQRMLGQVVPGLEDFPIEACAGDRFLGLDLCMWGTHQNEGLLRDLRTHEVEVYFVVYDILPILHPEWFPVGVHAEFTAWLQTVATVSNGLMCISHAVAKELSDCLESYPLQRPTPVKIGYFHLGADIGASAPSQGLSANADQLLGILKSRPSILSVGTLEPRKGHAQALAAFELLWAQGAEVNFVIVGKHGWMVDELVSRLKKHPEQGKRLFWLQGVSDEMLSKIYEASVGLLAASEGEGFGLPLIEAVQHKLPIIARNLPVFREVMGDHAFYFEGLAPHALADSLQVWLLMLQESRVTSSEGLSWLTWAASTQQLMDTIDQERGQ